MNFAKIWLSLCANGAVKFPRYCGKMCIRLFFSLRSIGGSERKDRRVKKQASQGESGSERDLGRKERPPFPDPPHFFLAGPALAVRPHGLRGLEQATLTDRDLDVFFHERTISPDKVTVQNKGDQTRSHFFSKILFIIS